MCDSKLCVPNGDLPVVLDITLFLDNFVDLTSLLFYNFGTSFFPYRYVLQAYYRRAHQYRLDPGASIEVKLGKYLRSALWLGRLLPVRRHRHVTPVPHSDSFNYMAILICC